MGVVPIRAMGARSRSGLYGTAGLSSFAMVSWLLFITPKVCRSVDLATMSPAMLPEAPALFSTMTGWPRALDSDSEIARAERSCTEPGGKPIRRRIGFDCQAAAVEAGPEVALAGFAGFSVCAKATVHTEASSRAWKARRESKLLFIFSMSSLRLVGTRIGNF